MPIFDERLAEQNMSRSIFGDSAAEDFFASFGADAEPDDLDLELEGLEADLDADIAEAEAEEEFGSFSSSSQYGRMASAPRPGYHPIGINESVLAYNLIWPPILRTASNFLLNNVPLTGVELDPFAAEAADIGEQFKEIVGEGTGTGTGFPDDRAAQIELLKEVIEDSAFGEDYDFKAYLIDAYNRGDGFFDTLKQMFLATDDAAIGWFTDDLPNLFASIMPAGTQEQLINRQAIMIWIADMMGIPVYDQILDGLLSTNSIIISPTRYPGGPGVEPAPAPLEAPVDWSLQEVAPPESGGLTLPEPRYILAAGYAAMVATPVIDALKKAFR